MLIDVMFWNQSEPVNLADSFKLSECPFNNILGQRMLRQSVFRERSDPPYLASSVE